MRTSVRAASPRKTRKARTVGAVRRVVLCSLDPNMERPELRQFKKSPMDQVLSDRGKYVAAALTVARAYAAAGYPDQLPALASFEDWSRIVRSALVWLGKPDPVQTMEAARAGDPTTSCLRAALVGWHGAVGGGILTVGKVIEAARQLDPLGNRINGDLYQALVDVAEERGGGINARKLGHWLQIDQLRDLRRHEVAAPTRGVVIDARAEPAFVSIG